MAKKGHVKLGRQLSKSTTEFTLTKLPGPGTTHPIVARLGVSMLALLPKTTLREDIKKILSGLSFDLMQALPEAETAAKIVGRLRDKGTSSAESSLKLEKWIGRYCTSITNAAKLAQDIEANCGTRPNAEWIARIAAFLPIDANGTASDTLQKLVDRIFLHAESVLVGHVRHHLPIGALLVEIPEEQRDPGAPVRFQLTIDPSLPLHFATILARALRLPLPNRSAVLGHSKLTIHTDFRGHKCVAVGNRIHLATDWKTFPDFLMDYIKGNFGKAFWEAETHKLPSKAHPVVALARRSHEYQNQNQRTGPGGLLGVIPNGDLLAYMCLEYDLYLLNHHDSLQKRLLKRLKNSDYNFDSARYELLISACFTRSGYDLMFNNEDGKAGKQVEFRARHRETGQRVDVEAKRRNRERIANSQPGRWEAELTLGLSGLLKDAFSKPHNAPLVVCLDLNIPVIDGDLFQKHFASELGENLSQIWARNTDGRPCYAAIILTNFPTEYSPNARPELLCQIHLSNHPDLPIIDPTFEERLATAFNTYGEIPQGFDD